MAQLPRGGESPGFRESLALPDLLVPAELRAELRRHERDDERELVGPPREVPEVERDGVRARRPPAQGLLVQIRDGGEYTRLHARVPMRDPAGRRRRFGHTAMLDRKTQ